MSISAFIWAKNQQLSGVDKSILLCIADRFNDERGYAWPSISRIAADTGWSSRTVSSSIARLKQAGLVETRRQYFSRDASPGPNRYYLPSLSPAPTTPAVFPIYGDFDSDGRWDTNLS